MGQGHTRPGRPTAILALASLASGEVYFSDTFEDLSKWTPSTWKGDQMGTFESAKAKYAREGDEDMAMATKVDARFYGASAAFPTFTNEGKDLIVQYQVGTYFHHRVDVDGRQSVCGGDFFL